MKQVTQLQNKNFKSQYRSWLLKEKRLKERPSNQMTDLVWRLVYTGISYWQEHWTCGREFESSNTGRNSGRIFFSRVKFVYWFLFCIRSTPLVPQSHVKDPGHSAKNAGGRLHLNAHTTLTQRTRSGLTMPLSRHNVGTYPEPSSHAACQGTFGHSRISSLSHYGLSWPKEWN